MSLFHWFPWFRGSIERLSYSILSAVFCLIYVRAAIDFFSFWIPFSCSVCSANNSCSSLFVLWTFMTEIEQSSDASCSSFLTFRVIRRVHSAHRFQRCCTSTLDLTGFFCGILSLSLSCFTHTLTFFSYLQVAIISFTLHDNWIPNQTTFPELMQLLEVLQTHT